MRIFITGGTGLIGRALIRHWQQHDITVLTRSTHKARELFGDNINAVSALAEIDINKFDAVVNLAGEPIAGKRWSTRQKQLLCDSRWQLTQALAEAIKQAVSPPAVFISGSAIGIYGAQQQQLISEDYSHFHDEFSHQLCQRWEALAFDAGAASRVCVLRTGLVLSQDGGALAKMLPPFKLGLGGKIGSGKQYMSWVHIQDYCRLVDFLLQHPTLQGSFNATAPNPVTNSEFSQTLAEVLQRPALLPMPALVLKLLLGEMSELLLSGQRVIPTNLVKAGFNFDYSTLKPALQDVLQTASTP